MAVEIVTGAKLIDITVDYLMQSNGVSEERQPEMRKICREKIIGFVLRKEKNPDTTIDNADNEIIRAGIANFLQAYAHLEKWLSEISAYALFYPRIPDRKYCSTYINEYEYTQNSFDMFLEYLEDGSDLHIALELAAEIDMHLPYLKTIFLQDDYAEIREQCTIKEEGVIPLTPWHASIISVLWQLKLSAVIEKYNLNKKYTGTEFTRELQKYAFIDWENKDNTLFDRSMIEARKLLKEDRKKLNLQMFAQEEEPAKEELLQVNAKKLDSLLYPVDKVNFSEGDIWHLLEEDTNGQITFAMETKADKRKGKQLDLTFSINFDSLEDDKALRITKRLEPYDKRVYIAAAALYNAGNKCVSLTQIHYAMGNKKYSEKGSKVLPSPNQLEKINNSITKMQAAQISIDNAMEAAAYKGYPHFKYDGSLFPMERITANINGKLTDAAVNMFREPPLIEFARQRQQIETIKPALLESPVNKTDKNIAVDDYLIGRILRAKKKPTEKILIETLCKNAGISIQDYKKRKKQYKELFAKLLDHYKENELIKEYVISDSDITVNPVMRK